MNIAIFGYSGFIGSHIVNVLNTRSPFEFTVLTNSVDIDTELDFEFAELFL